MAVLTSTGVTFGDGSTLSSTSTFLAIGSYALLFNYTTSNVAANTTTIAAANLGYVSGFNGGAQGNQVGDISRRSNNVSVPGTGASGYVNTTAVSGTWRCVSGVKPADYDPCAGWTTARQGMFVRVS